VKRSVASFGIPLLILAFAPVPATPRPLSSRHEALSIFLARSIVRRNAYDKVKIAVTHARIALATTLPNLTGLGTWTHRFITNTPRDGTESVAVSSRAAGAACGAGLGTAVPARHYLNGGLVQPFLAIETWHAMTSDK
jgi:hypothetical protein